MSVQAPFLEVRSFVAEETERAEPFAAPLTVGSPFLTLYEDESSGERVDPRAEEYALVLNELYDEEFEDSLYALAAEAAAVHEARFAQEHADARANGYEAERLLEQHFAPLVSEAHAMLDSLAGELGKRDAASLTDGEIDALVERYQASGDLSPEFEDFFGKLKRIVKKVAGKAVSLAKKGISLAAKLGLGPILEKLKALIKPLLRRVIQTAIGKLPIALQPVARKLAERLPFLKETESEASALEPADSSEVGQIQLEFDRQIADLLFANGEVEQQLQLAEVLAQPKAGDLYPIADLDGAREQFIERIGGLREGEDPTPHIQEFIPALLPALKLGIRIVGRKRVVDFLADLLAKLVQRFIGPRYAPALSQAIVDAGLRLIQLEASGEDESRAAASAVAATVEETVRRVSALPDYVLDNQELLEGFALEAFEQAAASNLPPVLPEETYRKRPELAEARRLRGVWVVMPRGRRMRYKKFSRRIPVRIVPHSVSEVESFEGLPLSEFLEEQVGLAPGEEVEAFAHLYETIQGTQLSELARMEQHTPGLGAADSHEQLHPLTPEAAGVLLGEPELGRDGNEAADPHSAPAGQRLYYLEIPGRKPLGIPAAPGRAQGRRPTQLRLVLDFAKDEIRIHFFLSEIRAQHVAVRLRRQGHVGRVVAHLRRYVERGLRNSLSGVFGRLKIVHEAVTPDQWLAALRRLPSFVPRILLGRLLEWVLKALGENLQQNATLFIKAAEDTADGVTVIFIISNPPGFAQLRQALKGKGVSLGSLRVSGDAPKVSVRFAPGYVRD